MRKLLNRLFLFNLQFKKNEHALKYRFIFLNNVFFFAAIVALGMGFLRWMQNPYLGMLDFSFAFIAFCLLIYLRYNKDKIEIISSIAIILTFFLFFVIYLFAPYNSTRIALFLLLSASAFFLKGRKKGFIWMAVILAAILYGHILTNINTGYNNIDILSISLYLLGLYFVFDNYEVIQEEQTEYLENLNLALELKVQERTRKLREVNAALEIEKYLLKNISSTDQLTGLYNRYKLEDLFEFEKLQMLRFNTKLSLIILDIDFFKSINDTQGHNTGDLVLKDIAALLKNNTRRSDVVVRWGGEEFVILAPKTTQPQAVHMAEKIRQTIKNHHFPGWSQTVTASFGIAVYEPGDTLEKIIQHADTALYLAKEAGRDNIVAYQKP